MAIDNLIYRDRRVCPTIRPAGVQSRGGSMEVTLNKINDSLKDKMFLFQKLAFFSIFCLGPCAFPLFFRIYGVYEIWELCAHGGH